jgi:hypothetical protein
MLTAGAMMSWPQRFTANDDSSVGAARLEGSWAQNLRKIGLSGIWCSTGICWTVMTAAPVVTWLPCKHGKCSCCCLRDPSDFMHDQLVLSMHVTVPHAGSLRITKTSSTHPNMQAGGRSPVYSRQGRCSGKPQRLQPAGIICRHILRLCILQAWRPRRAHPAMYGSLYTPDKHLLPALRTCRQQLYLGATGCSAPSASARP